MQKCVYAKWDSASRCKQERLLGMDAKVDPLVTLLFRLFFFVSLVKLSTNGTGRQVLLGTSDKYIRVCVCMCQASLAKYVQKEGM